MAEARERRVARDGIGRSELSAGGCLHTGGKMNRCRARMVGANPSRFLRAGSHAHEPNALLRSRQQRRRAARRLAARRQGIVRPDRGDRHRQPHQNQKPRKSMACLHETEINGVVHRDHDLSNNLYVNSVVIGVNR